MTSMSEPRVMSRQDAHSLQGSAAGPRSQLRALARTRAAVVLPTPRMPEKRYAWAIRPSCRALRKAVTIGSWPTRLEKFCGRHLRARTWYVMGDGSGLRRVPVKLRHSTAYLIAAPFR